MEERPGIIPSLLTVFFMILVARALFPDHYILSTLCFWWSATNAQIALTTARMRRLQDVG